MKIIEKQEQRTAEFGELSIGDVFYPLGGEYYIKVGNNDYNAVNLRNGIATHFGERTVVLKENATLIIGGEVE